MIKMGIEDESISGYIRRDIHSKEENSMNNEWFKDLEKFFNMIRDYCNSGNRQNSETGCCRMFGNIPVPGMVCTQMFGNIPVPGMVCAPMFGNIPVPGMVCAPMFGNRQNTGTGCGRRNPSSDNTGSEDGSVYYAMPFDMRKPEVEMIRDFLHRLFNASKVDHYYED